jgi:serine/threonine protein kinase
LIVTPSEPDRPVSGDAVTAQDSTRAKTDPGAGSQPSDTAGDSKTFVGFSPEIELRDAPIVPGDKIGKYQIRRQLGAGGMGAVYLAFDPLIEREVALKVLSPSLVNSSVALQRFLGEARAIGKLNHPHVVSIYEIDLWNEKYFLVMELLSGGSVADRLDQAGRIRWQDATRLVAEAARGLAAAHAVGLIHRDIKPDNLMLTADGAVKVVDFGLSKLHDTAGDQHSAVTQAGQILGTPQYMSPEQFDTADVDARTDVYSLGATYSHLLTGRFPYHECRTIVQMMSAHLTKPVPVPSQIEANLPAECDRIVAKAMAKNPADRYQTALDFAAALEALLQPAVAVTAAPELIDRPLTNALIVEPSKLQGAILKDALSRVGVAKAQVVSSAQDALQAVGAAAPDLLVTALELSDGRGIDLLQTLCQKSLLRQTTVVLNSSDSTLDELIAAGPAASLILAPKKVKPEEILRLAHATGPSVIGGGSLAAPIDPQALRVVIELDSGRIPAALAGLLRELKLIDVEVTPRFDPAAQSPSPNLVLLLHSKSVSIDFAALEHASAAGPLTAVVHVDGETVALRAVRRHKIVAVCERPLDARRMICLLQACRL